MFFNSVLNIQYTFQLVCPTVRASSVYRTSNGAGWLTKNRAKSTTGKIYTNCQWFCTNHTPPTPLPHPSVAPSTESMHYEKELCKKRAEGKANCISFPSFCFAHSAYASCPAVLLLLLLLCYVSFFTCPTTAGASLKTLTLGQRPAAASAASVAASACGSCNVTLRP